MHEPRLPIAATNSVCSACGSAFLCDIRAGKDRCWCFDLPRLLPLPGDSSSTCLCESCLKTEIVRRNSLHESSTAPDAHDGLH